MLAEELEHAAPGSRPASTATCWSVAASRRLSSSSATANGSSRETWAAARSASAAACSRAPASRRLSSSPATANGSSRETWAAARSSQRGGLLLRARLPQAVQQPGHGARVVEGDVGGGITAQQRGDLLLRARRPQPVQQPGHGARVVEGDVGGGTRGSSAVTCSCAPASRRLSSSAATARGSSRETWAAARLGQRGDLLLRARLPQAVQQHGHGARVVEGDVGGGIAVEQRGDLLLRARLPQAASSVATAPGLSRETWAAGSRRAAR